MRKFIEKYKETVKDLFLPFIAFLAWNIFMTDEIFERTDDVYRIYYAFDIVLCGSIPVITGFILYVVFRRRMSNVVRIACLIPSFLLLDFFTRLACSLWSAFLHLQAFSSYEDNSLYISNFTAEWYVYCIFLGMGIFGAAIRAIWLVVVNKLKTESRIKFLSYINKRALIFALMPAIFWIVIIVYAFLMNLAYD